MLDEIKAIITKNNLVQPTDVDALAHDMYAWYREHRRDMKPREFEMLLAKYPSHRTFKK